MFDQYAESGAIPRSAYIADGWHFECDKCSSFSAKYMNGDEVLCEDCFEEITGESVTA